MSIFLYHFSMKFMSGNRIVPDRTPPFAASHLGLFCLPMSHKRTPGLYGLIDITLIHMIDFKKKIFHAIRLFDGCGRYHIKLQYMIFLATIPPSIINIIFSGHAKFGTNCSIALFYNQSMLCTHNMTLLTFQGVMTILDIKYGHSVRCIKKQQLGNKTFLEQLRI